MFFGIPQVPTRASPVQLLHLATGEKSDINYNVETVKNLFLDPKLQDRNVVVFSIIGAFRKGKSFLMNYVLRYMYANVSYNLENFLRKKNGCSWGCSAGGLSLEQNYEVSQM